MRKGLLRPWQRDNIHTLDDYRESSTNLNSNSAAYLKLIEKNRPFFEELQRGVEENKRIEEESEALLKKADLWIQEKKAQKVVKNMQNSGNSKLCFRVSAVAGVAILIMILILLKHRDQQSLLNRAMR